MQTRGTVSNACSYNNAVTAHLCGATGGRGWHVPWAVGSMAITCGNGAVHSANPHHKQSTICTYIHTVAPQPSQSSIAATDMLHDRRSLISKCAEISACGKQANSVICCAANGRAGEPEAAAEGQRHISGCCCSTSSHRRCCSQPAQEVQPV